MLVKRIFDISISTVLLFFLSPLLLIIYILVKLSIKGEAFFLQDRVGKNNRIFKIIKFKTMRDIRDKTGTYLPDYKRITKLGEFLRELSLDELPELINVLKGDMSLVGPRPLLIQYLELYDDDQIRRHEVLPGITGLAQVNGRNNLKWSEKFNYDVWYVDNWSFWLDIKILFKTVYKVFKKDGINQAEGITMEYFNGKN
ncbi:Putative colanic biosynthesis UDP-glucose lipid carrier transferase [uncultured Clostridium sp.]|uniref:sugar transferase n=1 Tax=uncultured Clostridium sp. TaxID=59620 RepID=UPI000822BF46|nr:sugar transferase [uncultured Clostridium sp.]SCJ34071.1 Putative colanic biosynthesis UDP-glucose lipid carrier transferase [uncultured Clostridium sp.]